MTGAPAQAPRSMVFTCPSTAGEAANSAPTNIADHPTKFFISDLLLVPSSISIPALDSSLRCYRDPFVRGMSRTCQERKVAEIRLLVGGTGALLVVVVAAVFVLVGSNQLSRVD